MATFGSEFFSYRFLPGKSAQLYQRASGCIRMQAERTRQRPISGREMCQTLQKSLKLTEVKEKVYPKAVALLLGMRHAFYWWEIIELRWTRSRPSGNVTKGTESIERSTASSPVLNGWKAYLPWQELDLKSTEGALENWRPLSRVSYAILIPLKNSQSYCLHVVNEKSRARRQFLTD